MHCTQCGAAALPDAKFCGACGSPLGVSCKSCGLNNDRQATTCAGCGASLVELAKSVAERRHLTIFFVDLVGSTSLAASLDPEELRDFYARYQDICGDAIKQYEGHIAQYLGDGIMAYFGYPNAHEDDALRAIRAGLEILTRVEDVMVGGIRPSVRIGIHTGLVVVGDVGSGQRQETLALGEAPNVAARVQAEAVPDSLLISEATRQLVAGSFRLEDLGSRILKGISQPMQIWRVLGLSDAASRFEAAAASGLAPFVGREAELDMIRTAWMRAVAGSGQTVLLRGEAGIGKSRLLGAARSMVSDDDHVEFAFECSPYHGNSAFYPIVQMLERRLGLDEEAPPAEAVGLLERLATERSVAPPEAVPLLAALLEIPVGEPYAQLELAPEMQRQRTMGVLAQLLVGSPGGVPTLVVMEDLHWADPTTLELVTSVVARQGDVPMLVLASTRPDLPSLWTPEESRRDHTVEALPSDDTRALVAGVVGGKSLPDKVLEEIVARTGGIPLFVEAVTRTVVDAGVLEELDDRFELTGPMPTGLIPATVHDSLMARIDMLGEHKGVAQLAATIGRQFSQQLLLALSGLSSHELEEALRHLMDLDLVSRRGLFPHWTYEFKHALLRDAAYESLLRKTRQEYHGRIATTLRDRFPDVADEQPELLARHFEEAGLVDDAVAYHQRAGQRAMKRGAHVEAMAAFTRAIELLADQDETEERVRQELALRASMGGSLVATRGYCAPEFEENALRSRELCDALGTPPELAPVLYNLWVLNLAASRREPTEKYAQELLDFTHTLPEGPAHVSAWFAQGTTLLYRGRFEEARAAFDRALEHWSPDMHEELVRTYGDDHGLFAQVYLEWLYLFVGEPARARRMTAHTLRQADEFVDPLAQALTLAFAMIVHHDLRDPEGTREYAERTIDLTTQQGFPFWRSTALVGRGLHRVEAGELAEGRSEIENGLGFFDLIQQKLPLTYWTSYLVEALLASGAYEEGVDVVDRLLEMSATNVDSFFEPELWRLRGALLEAAHGDSDDAYACYERALAAARETGAAFYELRAATGMAGLMRARGESDEARELVSGAVAKIVDGEDLPDVRDAHEVLERLETESGA